MVLGEWLDRPIEADLDVAVEADRLGYGEVWIGEMAKFDAPAMAAAIVARTARIEPVLGPLAVTVRSPAQIALAAATVAATGRRTHVALGTSSDVVARWHGRRPVRRRRPAGHGDGEVRALLAGGAGRRVPPAPAARRGHASPWPRSGPGPWRSPAAPTGWCSTWSPSRPPPRSPPSTPTRRRGWPPPSTRRPEERRWLTLGFVGYLGAPGYGEMFAAAGFADLVAFARTRPRIPRSWRPACPTSCSTPSPSSVRRPTCARRIDAYAAAGLPEIGLVVPPLDTPSGRPHPRGPGP